MFLRTTASLLIAIAHVLVAQPAHAQECLGKLKMDVLQQSSSAELKRAHFHKACAQKYNEFDKSWGTSAAFEFKKIGGSGSYNKTNYEKWYESECKQIKTSEHESSASYFYSEVFGSNALEAYRLCLNSKKLLSCSPEAHGNSIGVLVSWNLGGGVKAKVLERALEGGSTSSKLINTNSVLGDGDTTVIISPDSEYKFVRFTLNVQFGENGRRTCDVYVAPRKIKKNKKATQTCLPRATVTYKNIRHTGGGTVVNKIQESLCRGKRYKLSFNVKYSYVGFNDHGKNHPEDRVCKMRMTITNSSPQQTIEGSCDNNDTAHVRGDISLLVPASGDLEINAYSDCPAGTCELGGNIDFRKIK